MPDEADSLTSLITRWVSHRDEAAARQGLPVLFMQSIFRITGPTTGTSAPTWCNSDRPLELERHSYDHLGVFRRPVRIRITKRC